MGVSNFKDLREHVGHTIVCVQYGDEESGCVNVALECEDCNEVLMDFDKPEDAGFVPLKGSHSGVICPLCLYGSSMEDWNKTTRGEYSQDIRPLTEKVFTSKGTVDTDAPAADCFYICPCCGGKVLGKLLREGKEEDDGE